MVRAAVCQPLATSRPNIERRAASSSRWNGCGSYCCAKAIISFLSIRARPFGLNTCPTAKSSKYRSVIDRYPRLRMAASITGGLGATRGEIPKGRLSFFAALRLSSGGFWWLRKTGTHFSGSCSNEARDDQRLDRVCPDSICARHERHAVTGL